MYIHERNPEKARQTHNGYLSNRKRARRAIPFHSPVCVCVRVCVYMCV